MKHLLRAFAVGLCCMWNGSVVGGEFINLDFESADLTGSVIEHRTLVTDNNPGPTAYPFGYGPIDKLLPGWQVVVDDSPDGRIYPDIGYIGNGAPMLANQPFVGLMLQGDKLSPYHGQNPEGRFGLVLHTREGPRGILGPIKISQIGEVPLDARVLTFNYFGITSFSLAINDRLYTPPTPELGTSGFGPTSQYSFDISPWAGETINLGFIVGGPGGRAAFDSIRFVIPEPSPVLLGMFAAVLFLIFRNLMKRPASKVLMDSTSGLQSLRTNPQSLQQ